MGNFREGDTIVAVNVHSLPFSGNGVQYGRVTRNTDNLENLIAQINKKHPAIDSYAIRYAAELLGDEMLSRIQAGSSVNVLGLGVLHIGIAGAIKGKRPDIADVPGFKVGFTPSEKTKEAVKLIKVDLVTKAEVDPEISEIIDLRNGEANGDISVNTVMRIKGKKLRIAGSDSGIFFAEIVAGTMETDESLWEKVDLTTLSHNTAKQLDFFIPSDVVKGKSYCIVLRTRYTAQGEAKQIREAISNSFNIV